MDKEMQRALALDGKKLRQLTGEDHGPWFLCQVCGGWGHLEFVAGVERDCKVLQWLRMGSRGELKG